MSYSHRAINSRGIGSNRVRAVTGDLSSPYDGLDIQQAYDQQGNYGVFVEPQQQAVDCCPVEVPLQEEWIRVTNSVDTPIQVEEVIDQCTGELLQRIERKAKIITRGQWILASAATPML